MIRALWTGATGMTSERMLIDAISNNLANVNTTGYKKQRVEFQDLYYQYLSYGSAGTVSVGSGSRTVAVDRSFTQGNLEQTDDPLSVAIEGPGFFRLVAQDGSYSYTRDGSFRLDAQGRLCTAGGYLVRGVDGPVVIPSDATEIHIADDGAITGRVGDVEKHFGTLELAVFTNPRGLLATGANQYRETPSSGQAVIRRPGTAGVGTLLGGWLETSNVEIITEMVNLIVAQRAFELNSKTVETADQMWAIANNVKR